MAGESTESREKIPLDDIVPSNERHRPLVSVAFVLAAGIVFAKFAEASPLLCLLIAAAGSLLALIAIRKIAPDILRDALIVLLIFGAGAANYAWRDTPKNVDGLVPTGSTLCTLTGTVSGEITETIEFPLIPEKNSPESLRRSVFRLHVKKIGVNKAEYPFECDVLVSVQENPPAVRHGDTVTAFGWLRPLNAKSERYAMSEGFSGRFNVAAPEAILVVKEGRGSFLRSLYSIKSFIRGLFEDYREELSYLSDETVTLVTAMILGDRSEMSSGLRNAFNNSGTTHILAISGLHVGLVYAALSLICRLLLMKRLPRRIIILSVVVAYAAITGFGTAVMRSALMILLFELADFLRFRRDSLNAVAAAAIIILCIAPHHLFEAGFQLTFIAVIAIILFARKISFALVGPPDELERITDPRFRSKWRTCGRKTWEIIAAALGVSAAATLAVTPIQAYYFGVITPISIFATTLLLPVISLFITFGFAFLAAAPFMQFAAAALAYTLSGLSWLFVTIVGKSAEISFGHAFVPPPKLAWIVAFYAVLFLAAARKQLRFSPAGALIMPLCLGCLYLGQQAITSPPREFSATFIDVGHGTSVILNGSGLTVLYDCGAGTAFSTYDVGLKAVTPAIWENGSKRIDVLILSHNHHDHVNGVPSLLDRFNVGEVIVTERFGKDEVGQFILAEIARRKIHVRIVKAGDVLSFGGMRLDVLWPPPESERWRLSNVNDQSIAVKVSSGGRSLFLTGDVETQGMAGLMTLYGQNLQAELLYVPHHGADTEYLEDFIKMVSPQKLIVSSSTERKDNIDKISREFPTAEMSSTQSEGTIQFRYDSQGWKKRVVAAD